jgi:hypothetical protein
MVSFSHNLGDERVQTDGVAAVKVSQPQRQHKEASQYNVSRRNPQLTPERKAESLDSHTHAGLGLDVQGL